MNFLKIYSTDYATFKERVISGYFSIFLGFLEESPKALIAFLSFSICFFFYVEITFIASMQSFTKWRPVYSLKMFKRSFKCYLGK